MSWITINYAANLIGYIRSYVGTTQFTCKWELKAITTSTSAIGLVMTLNQAKVVFRLAAGYGVI